LEFLPIYIIEELQYFLKIDFLFCKRDVMKLTFLIQVIFFILCSGILNPTISFASSESETKDESWEIQPRKYGIDFMLIHSANNMALTKYCYG